MEKIDEFDKVIRVGEVYSVNGRTVKILVDENKNDSHLLYKGTLIKNVSVGSYIKIAKGFIRIIAKVEGEYIDYDKNVYEEYHSAQDIIQRYLEVKLLGYIDNNSYSLGIKEMPLIGNECYLLIDEEFQLIHQFSKSKKNSIKIGSLLMDDEQEIRLGINELFSSHIGIFGNTGSGKSYTLAKLYHQLFELVLKLRSFKKKAKFVLFDFNGEYSTDKSITQHKTVYKLSTRDTAGDRIDISENDLLKPELISILASATEKTQQPFIKRALNLYNQAYIKNNPTEYTRGIIRNLLIQTLRFEDSLKGNYLIKNVEQILLYGYEDDSNEQQAVTSFFERLGFNSTQHCYYIKNEVSTDYYNNSDADKKVEGLEIYSNIDSYNLPENAISIVITFILIQLNKDIISNRVVNDHVAPAINKLKGHQQNFEKVFAVNKEDSDIFKNCNLIVIDMNSISTEMKKLVPLLISQKLYNEHKVAHVQNKSESLHIIIDEAHNILSHESVRESETWKDYRLETFEEIIKEGRKFGVFLTIASQRPSDISHTIISQIHNFFIHRLVNQRDIDMIGNNVSYLDKLSVEQLPNLPTGGCIVAGVMTQLPVLVQIEKMNKEYSPQSSTINLIESWEEIDLF